MFIVFGNSAMYVIMFSFDNMLQEITDAFQSLWMFIHSSFPLLPHLYRIAKFCFICCTEQRYPDAETLKTSCVWTENKIKRLKRRQQRLSGYRSLTFWAHPDITRLVRRSLASCTYMMVRALFPHQVMTGSSLTMCFHYTALRPMPQKMSDILWHYTLKIILIIIIIWVYIYRLMKSASR